MSRKFAAPIKRSSFCPQVAGLEDRVTPALTVYFQSAAASTAETAPYPNGPSYVALVYVFGTVEQSTTVSFSVTSTSGPSPAASAGDYMTYGPTTYSRTFSPSAYPVQDALAVPIQAFGDGVQEPDEYLTLGLSGVTGASVGSPATSVVKIVGDIPTVTVSASSKVAEGGSGTVTVSRTSQYIGQALPVTLVLSGGGGAVDYTLNGSAGGEGEYTFTMPANVGSVDLPLAALRDNLVEGDEFLGVAVKDGMGNTPKYYAGTTTPVSVTITDDPPVVTVAKLSDSAEPGGIGAFRFTRSGGDTTSRLTPTVTFDSGSATANTDFTAPGSVSFDPDVRTVDVPIVSIDDTDVETGEAVRAVVASNTTAVPGGTGAATLRILDDDAVLSGDTAEAKIHRPVLIDVLGNDTGAVRIVSAATSDGGVVEVVGDGHMIRYTPAGGQTRQDHITYRVTTADGLTAPSAGFVTVDVVRPPVYWEPAVGGAWENPYNWSIWEVPAATDDVTIGLPASETVTVSSGVARRLGSSGSLSVVGGLTVYGFAAVSGAMNVSGVFTVSTAAGVGPPGEYGIPELGPDGPGAVLSGGGSISGQVNTAAGVRTDFVSGLFGVGGQLGGGGWYTVGTTLSLDGGAKAVANLGVRSGGVVNGAADLTVDGTLVWDGGAFAGPGFPDVVVGGLAFILAPAPAAPVERDLIVKAGATATVTADRTFADGARLLNNGTIDWKGNLLLSFGPLSTVTNYGTMRLEDGGIRGDKTAGDNPVYTKFTNAGTITIVGGDMHFDAVDFRNNGTLSVPVPGGGGTVVHLTGGVGEYGAASLVELGNNVILALQDGTKQTLRTGSRFRGQGVVTLMSASELTVPAGEVGSMERLQAFGGGTKIIGDGVTPTLDNQTKQTVEVPKPGGRLEITKNFEWGGTPIWGVTTRIMPQAKLVVSDKSQLLGARIEVQGQMEVTAPIDFAFGSAISLDASGGNGVGKITGQGSLTLNKSLGEQEPSYLNSYLHVGPDAVFTWKEPGTTAVCAVLFANLGGTVNIGGGLEITNGYHQSGGYTHVLSNVTVAGHPIDSLGGQRSHANMLIRGGVIDVADGATVFVDNNFQSGGLKVIDATLVALGGMDVSGWLFSTGSVVVVGGVGTFGRLQLAGGLQLDAGSTLRMDISANGLSYDSVLVNEFLFLAGTLDVTGVGGNFVNANAAAYKLLETRSPAAANDPRITPPLPPIATTPRQGAFGDITLHDLPVGWQADPRYLATQFLLAFT